jgi:hypothetical protein
MSRRQNSARLMGPAPRVSKCYEALSSAAGRASIWALMALAAAGVFVFCQAAALHAQGQKSKLPIVGKLATGNQQQAYSGKVQSLDMKQKILNVDSLRGQDSEIFPVKKNLRVEGINGNRLDLKALTPGATVLIYFDQKSGERTVKNIVVLSSGKGQAKGKPAPSS